MPVKEAHGLNIDVSGHAIDRASLRCLPIWQKTRAAKGEGLYTWLCRIAKEALDRGEVDRRGRYKHRGMLLAIEYEGKRLLVKTVMKSGRDKRRVFD